MINWHKFTGKYPYTGIVSICRVYEIIKPFKECIHVKGDRITDVNVLFISPV